MIRPIHSLVLSNERDVVSARQRARCVAGSLGFDHPEQIRIATAVSEIARNAFRYARRGSVAFSVDALKRLLLIVVSDQGGGIPHLDAVMSGSYRSLTGMGMGIVGTKRLMDEFDVETSRAGTRVSFGKRIPLTIQTIDDAMMQRVSAELARQHPATPIDELQIQNRELLNTLNELKERKEELLRTNEELQDTNRGVVALYAELDERADYLRRASELKSSFLANMSHEFRTPLNSMLALTRMLLDRMDGELNSEQDQQIRFIQKSAKELSEMVDDLLDLAKVEAGKLDVKAKHFEISDLFGALRGMLKPLLAQSSLTLVFEAAEDLPPLFTDEQKVSQILRNLISNAIKFTARGEVRISAQCKDTMIEVAVADTGVGISVSDQRIIFAEFEQVENSLQKHVKGTGLGLPLSRKLAELLGGAVTVDSEVGIGSTFYLQVPLIYSEARPPIELALPNVEQDKKLVLIVEDNCETAFIYARYLANAGFQSHAVASVAEAKSVLARLRPSAIILDLVLQGETTWDLLRDLKTDERQVPVLVMSSSDDQRKVFGLGADAFLAKPFQPDAMIAEIMKLTSDAPRIRILIIDDNEVSRYLLRDHLPGLEYEVFEARDGREGIRLANQLKPDIIFLDFYMPGLTGMDVLKDLRRSNDLGGVPIVLHSTKTLDPSELNFFSENRVVIFAKQSLTLPDSSIRIKELMAALVEPVRADQ